MYTFPNHYGIYMDLTKYKYFQPVCTPARMVIVLGAMSGLTTIPHAAFNANAILQISAACLKYVAKQ